MIIGIDPGTKESAFAVLDEYEGIVVRAEILSNRKMERYCSKLVGVNAAIEMVASYGMPVGKDVFETVYWTGRFAATLDAANCDLARLYRLDVKLFLCGNSRAKDANVRQALIDMFPASGGGSTPQIGTKKQKGPLYGLKADMWAALGVAVTHSQRRSFRKD